MTSNAVLIAPSLEPVDRLRDDIGDDALCHVLGVFIREIPNYQASLRDPQTTMARSACHNLKIHLVTFGCMEWAELARHTETAIVSQSESASAACERLITGLGEIEIALNRYRDTLI